MKDKDIYNLIVNKVGLGILWWYAETNYPGGVEHAKKRLTKDLEYYK